MFVIQEHLARTCLQIIFCNKWTSLTLSFSQMPFTWVELRLYLHAHWEQSASHLVGVWTPSDYSLLSDSSSLRSFEWCLDGVTMSHSVAPSHERMTIKLTLPMSHFCLEHQILCFLHSGISGIFSNSIVNFTKILIAINLPDYLKYLNGEDSRVGRDNLSQAYIPVKLPAQHIFSVSHTVLVLLPKSCRNWKGKNHIELT